MMKFSTVKYFFREAFANLFKNSVMTIASVVTVFSCILMIIFTFSIVTNLEYVLQQFEQTLDLEIFIDNEVSPEDVMLLYEDISQIEHIESIEFISHYRALEIFREYMDGITTYDEFGNVTSISILPDDINPTIFPRSFRITVDHPGNIEYVYAEVLKLSYRGFEFQDIYNTLYFINSINSIIRIISTVIVLFLIANSIVIIINTVRITVNTRKNDINIMKYVGATDWFIKWPFIIEGALIGFIGSLLPLGIGFLMYINLIEIVSDSFFGILSFRTAPAVFTFLVPFCILLGIGIGILGSANAVRKYLKV
jgi:cell division transport system permease protein